MDLREHYKAHEPKPTMEEGSGSDGKPVEVAPQNKLSSIEHRIDQMNGNLLAFLDVLETTITKPESIINHRLQIITDKCDGLYNQIDNIKTVQVTTAVDENKSEFLNAQEQKDYIEMQLQRRITKLEAELEAQRTADTKSQQKKENTNQEIAGFHDEMQDLQRQIQEERERVEKAEAAMGIYEVRVKALTDDRDDAQSRCHDLLADMVDMETKWEDKLEEMIRARDDLEDIQRVAYDREKERCRKLFDQVQDLKGSIRVMCRIRPAPCDVSDAALMNFGAPERGEFSDNWGKLNLQTTRKAAMGEVTETKTYNFERIFGQDETNNDVFYEVEDLVQSSLEGKKVCLFAYGQTGSGKTHTMLGTKSSPGIIPRTATMIFDAAAVTEDSVYKIELSVIEIYQDDIHDLLLEPLGGVKAAVRLSEATWTQLNTEAEAVDLLERASRHRTVAATNANEQSSRSHLVISWRVGREVVLGRCRGRVTAGTLNLVDLAGSERTAAAGATGAQRREGIAINSDLMNLNLVITALGNGTRVPYDSALTRTLRDSLTQGSRTLMLVMVSPFKKDQSQTVQTLEKGAEATKARLSAFSRTNNFAGGGGKRPASGIPTAKNGTCSRIAAAATTTTTPSQQTGIPRPPGSKVTPTRASLTGAHTRTPRTPGGGLG